jgi:Trk K+ transport system NAD-binding subunit
MKHIEEEIPAHPLAHLLTMMAEGTEIVEIIISEDSKAIGKSPGQLKIPKDAILALIIREGERPQVPTMDTVFEKGDRIIAMTSVDSENTLKEQFINEPL